MLLKAMRGWMKGLLGGVVGLLSGAAAMYGTAVVDRVVQPTKPVANFAVTADGLTVTCLNHATGESGWWDFGDGSPLEPFQPGQEAVPHRYAKPGSYAVKLTVRNFLSDENERTVPVDLTGTSLAQGPAIREWKVETIGQQAIAPATFRIRGEVQHAEKVIWDMGDNRQLEVSTESGPFERLVVFEKPGQYPIQLIGQSGKQAVKQAAVVSVSQAQAGALSAVLKVSDSGSRVDRQTFTETATVPVPAKGAKGFDKAITARPGYAIAGAKVGAVKPGLTQNVRVEVAADRRSARLVGEWAATGDDAKRAAGGTDVIVPVALTEERTVPVAMPPAMMSGLFQTVNGQTYAVLTLPPQTIAAAGATRKVQLELRQAFADGRSRVVTTVPDLKMPWAGRVNLGADVFGVSAPTHTVSARQQGNNVFVMLTN